MGGYLNIYYSSQKHLDLSFSTFIYFSLYQNLFTLITNNLFVSSIPFVCESKRNYQEISKFH